MLPGHIYIYAAENRNIFAATTDDIENTKHIWFQQSYQILIRIVSVAIATV